MLQTLLVYSLLLSLMLLLNATSVYRHDRGLYIGKRRQSNVPILALLVFAFVFGIRYDVGMDHLSYLRAYESTRLSIAGYIEQWEIGFVFITRLFAEANLHFAFYFAFLAFLQVFVLFYALRGYYKIHSYVIVILILSGTFLSFMNGIRQELAFCFWVLAVTFIAKKKILPYFICVLLAFSFHFSAILLIPIYFFYRRREYYFSNLKLQLLLLFTSVFIMLTFNPVNAIMEGLAGIIEAAGYGIYVEMMRAGDMIFMEPIGGGTGIGIFFLLFVDITLICLSPKVKKYFKSPFLYIIYDLYFVGALFSYIAFGSLALQRINIYFHNFSFVIAAFTLYYLAKNNSRENKLLQYWLFTLYLLLFAALFFIREEFYSTFWQNM